ncbi:DUF416 family protein [Anaerocolumna jejuensis]|uniref:DUF416 family protein n=1 Tax=Anaerocolumna jejuensis TaxID=259063 RepID=UPI003F7B9600
MSIMSDHTKKITVKLGDAPYCKVSLFEIMAVERLWKVYEKLSIDRYWDKRDIFRGLLDMIWDAIKSNDLIDDKYLEICDENNLDTIRQEIDTVSNDVINAIGTLIDEMNKKKSINVKYFVNINFEFLDKFIYWKYDLQISAESDDFVNNHELIKQEIEKQNTIIDKITSEESFDVIYAWCKQNCGDSILGEYWFDL